MTQNIILLTVIIISGATGYCLGWKDGRSRGNTDQILTLMDLEEDDEDVEVSWD